MKRTIFSLSLLALGAQLWSQELYQYKLRKLSPERDIATCRNRMEEFSSKFAEQAGVEIITTSCQPEEFASILKHWEGVVSYSAEQRATFSNAIGIYGDGINNYQDFPTMAACEGSREKQEADYEHATGLDVLYSYCFQSTIVSAPRFTLQIEALGTPTRRRFVGAIEMYGHVVPEDFGAQIIRRLQNRGLIVTHVASAAQNFTRYLQFDYYAEQRRHFESIDHATFESVHQCKANLDRVASSLYDTTPQVVGVFCDGGSGPSGIRLHIAIDRGGYDENSRSPVKHHRLQSGYQSRAACEADLPRLKSILQDQGIAVIAQVCSYKDRSFTSDFYTKTR